jgi:hypothetical protein
MDSTFVITGLSYTILNNSTVGTLQRKIIERHCVFDVRLPYLFPSFSLCTKLLTLPLLAGSPYPEATMSGNKFFSQIIAGALCLVLGFFLGQNVGSEEKDMSKLNRSQEKMQQPGSTADRGKPSFAFVSHVGGKVGGFTGTSNSQYVSDTGLVQLSREESNNDSSVVGRLYGRILMAEGQTPEGIRVKLFNGYQTIQEQPSSDGSFSLPIHSSSPGTYLALFILKEGFSPVVHTLKYTGENLVKLDPISFNKPLPSEKGAVAGLVFSTVLGGKLHRRYGIEKLERVDIRIRDADSNEDEHLFSSGSSGSFVEYLLPGSYNIRCLHINRELTLRRGEVKVIFFHLSEKLVD